MPQDGNSKNCVDWMCCSMRRLPEGRLRRFLNDRRNYRGTIFNQQSESVICVGPIFECITGVNSGIDSFLKESVTVFRVHAIVQLVMIAVTPIPTTRGQLCLAIDKIFSLPW